MTNPKLTDDEVCHKFGIAKTDPSFKTARGLSNHRPDRVICVIPDMMCPHCMHEFTATFHDLGSNDPGNGNEVPCENCERSMYVESIAEPDEEDDGQDVYVTLCTHPETEG